MAKTGKIPVYYWDACVFLAAITGEQGRRPIVESILEKCQSGGVSVCTSILSITEVAFSKAEKTGGTLNQNVEHAIEELWAPSSNIRTIELHRLIAVRAKEIIREAISMGLAGIKPADAIHLATAKSVGVDEFHTYDKSVIKNCDAQLQVLLGFTIREPHKELDLFDGLDDGLDETERPQDK